MTVSDQTKPQGPPPRTARGLGLRNTSGRGNHCVLGMTAGTHARNDSFGEFVDAPVQGTDATSTTGPAPAAHDDGGVLDLRGVERQLDAAREAPLAEAMATEMVVPMAGATVVPDLVATEEPHSVTSESDQKESEPPAPGPASAASSSTSHWSSSLWNKLSSLSAFVDGSSDASAARHRPRRRPSVVHSASHRAPIRHGRMDMYDMPHWNRGQWSLSAEAEREREQRPVPVVLQDRREDTDAVVEPWHAARIHAQVPRRLRLGKTWKLIYSLDQHGASLATLYSRVDRAFDSGARSGAPAEGWLLGSSSAAQAAVLGKDTVTPKAAPLHIGGGVNLSAAGLVIAVCDAKGHVFGAFVNERLRIASHYYGNGECFLWKTVRRRLPKPPTETDGEARHDDDLHPDMAIEVFRWTGKNDYMVLSESNFLSVGGGDGRYGLWLDDTLVNGVSAKCPTFNNQVLCDDNESEALHATDTAETQPPADLLGHNDEAPQVQQDQFQILGVEVWAVGLD